MASSHKERLAIISSSKLRTPISRVSDVSTPGSKNVGSPLSDEAIWMRLREAGFDEESIKRRDKAALIAYIAKLESEMFDYQHHMGLLIVERKDWASKYEQLKASVDSTEMKHKLDQAAHSSALAEARKREESLKKALAIEKECISNIEKTLHEMRAESAEIKVAADSKMVEARNMFEDAQKKFIEAGTKLLTAESMQAEASRYRHAAERKLQEVEEREDDLRRRLISFNSKCDAKEKEISLERQSLCERQKIVQQGQERLLDAHTLLDQREEYISGRSNELSLLEKELEASKAQIEKETKSLYEEKLNLETKLADLSTREEAVIQKEALLNKKEEEFLVEQEKLASKTYAEIQMLKAEEEAALERRKSIFEAELEEKRKFVENEIEIKRRVWELREVDLVQREELIQEKEQEHIAQLRALMEKEKDTMEGLKSLQEKEESLRAAEKAAEMEKIHLQKEKEEVQKMKLDLEKSSAALESKRKEIEKAQVELEAAKSERNELLVLERNLKQEIDTIREQKMKLIYEADQLKAEKAKFETEWDCIDEKRAELQREAECVAEEREAVSKFLKDERDNLKLEKESIRDQVKHDLESLSREREAFISKMDLEHSEWFSKIQQERSNFVMDIENQKKELENCIEKRREEVESYLREKEEAFEQEKKKELQNISSLKEILAKDQEYIASEMRRLENERREIVLDRERREKEQAELNKSIDELEIQRNKLKEQRELLHEDREKIVLQIQHLNELEKLEMASQDIVLSQIQKTKLKSSRRNLPVRNYSNLQTAQDAEVRSNVSKQAPDASPPSSTPVSWIRRCAERIFKPSPETLSVDHEEKSLVQYEDAKLLEDNYLNDKEQLPKGKDGAPNRRSRLPMRTEEGKVPSVGQRVSRSYRADTDTKVSALCSYPEQGLQVGRKRQNDSSSHDTSDDIPLKQYTKKMRPNRDACRTSVEDSTSNCALSNRALYPENGEGLKSLAQITKDLEEAANVSGAGNGVTTHGSTELTQVEEVRIECHAKGCIQSQGKVTTEETILEAADRSPLVGESNGRGDSEKNV